MKKDPWKKWWVLYFCVAVGGEVYLNGMGVGMLAAYYLFALLS